MGILFLANQQKKANKMEQKKSIRSIIKEELSEYQKFFKSALDKFGVKSPDELSDEKKKKFFNYVDNNYDAKNEQKTRKNESSMGSKYDAIVDAYSGMKFVFNRGLAANIGKGYIPGTCYHTVTEKVRILIYIFNDNHGGVQLEIYENDKRFFMERFDYSKMSFPYHLLKEITGLSKLELMINGSVVYA